MSSHFKFYPGSESVVIPPNARYSFPSQANKAVKTMPRIPPKNGSEFTPGSTIRLEFPAQGYVNTNATSLVFDVYLQGYTAPNPNNGRAYFQNNIQSIFNRVRLLYGATPLEDMLEYNIWVRQLTEWTSTNNNNFDQFTINEGIGRVALRGDEVQHARLCGIHANNGVALTRIPNDYAGVNAGDSGTGTTGFAVRRYQVQLALGLLTQGKYIPAKFMASQLAIEITLAQPKDCIIGQPTYDGATAGTTDPTYKLKNVFLLPEILEFDSSYDAMMIKGLNDGGIPLKINKLHTFTFQQGGSNIANIIIPERSRSVKSVFTVIRRQASSYENDMGTTFGSLEANNFIDSYQYRIGGRYFPPSPVQVSGTMSGSSTFNGGTEAYIELAKCLNTFGDYRLSCGVNALSWNLPYVVNPQPFAAGEKCRSLTLGESDGNYSVNFLGGAPFAIVQTAGNVGSDMGNGVFCMATNLETSNGAELSGLNAEEQSDISLQINWTGTAPASGTFIIQTFVLYDAVIILKPNNNIELIE